MKTFKITYLVTEGYEEEIKAESFEDAQKKWEAEGHEGELFIIEDENGDQLVF